MRIGDNGSKGMKQIVVLHVLCISPSVKCHRAGFELTLKIINRRVRPAEGIYEVLLFRVLYQSSILEPFCRLADLVEHEAKSRHSRYIPNFDVELERFLPLATIIQIHYLLFGFLTFTQGLSTVEETGL